MRYIHRGFCKGYGHSQDCHAHTSPSVKEALRIAAGQEHRSIVNMVEILILSNCERYAIAIPPFGETKSNNGAYS